MTDHLRTLYRRNLDRLAASPYLDVTITGPIAPFSQDNPRAIDQSAPPEVAKALFDRTPTFALLDAAAHPHLPQGFAPLNARCLFSGVAADEYGKDHVHVVGNIHKQDIYADHLVKTGRNRDETMLGTYTLNVNKSITNNTKVHTLMAFDKFVIKGPGGKITTDTSGITLEAPQINLKGNVSMGGSGGAQVPTLQGAANDGLPLVEECLTQEGEE